jgi:alpha-amylase
LYVPDQPAAVTIFDLGGGKPLFDDAAFVQRLLDRCDRSWAPAIGQMAELARRYPGKLRVACWSSGRVLELLQLHRPALADTLRALSGEGTVEWLASPEEASLAFAYDRKWMISELDRQHSLLYRILGAEPSVLALPGLAYLSPMGFLVHQLGYRGWLIGGAELALHGRSPVRLYHPPHLPELPLLLRHAALSEDLEVRWGQPDWEHAPLSAARFREWIPAGPDDLTTLVFGLHAFGGRWPAGSGIFSFWQQWLELELAEGTQRFVLPSEAVQRTHSLAGPLEALDALSWTGFEAGLPAWRGNELQQAAFAALLDLRNAIWRVHDEALQALWLRLSDADHLLWMADAPWRGDGKLFSDCPFPGPHAAYLNFMNQLADLELRLPH